MLAFVTTGSLAREPVRDTINRQESDRNLRVAPESAAPAPLLAEPAAHALSSPTAGRPAEPDRSWNRFLTILLRALSAWPG